MPDASPELTGIRTIKYYVVAYKSATKVNFIHQLLDLARLIPHQIFNYFKYLHHRTDDGCEMVMMFRVKYDMDAYYLSSSVDGSCFCSNLTVFFPLPVQEELLTL
jgi:hypothetical protein